ncbi:MAG: dihydrofolate reductase family protein [Flavobacteriaceae bacterium]
MDTKTMTKKNKVFIATSLDGYIAEKDGGIDWLHAIPNPENLDMGYVEFTSGIDALVMGRTTFETVCSFGIDWPYTKPVFVLSNSLTKVADAYKDKVELVKGDLKEVVAEIHQKGFPRLYIDGGKTIQSFLKEDLIDEMIITIIPTLLGGGIPLFNGLLKPLDFKCVSTKIFLGEVVQNHFIRKKA